MQGSFSKLLSNEAWKEICHFLHWAVISSHPNNRNGTDPFCICLMLFIVQQWENLKNAKHEKSREKFKFKIWNKIVKVSKMTDNFQFLNRQEMFSLSLEQTAKCNVQGAEKKNQHPSLLFVKRCKALSASYLVMRLGKKFVISCIGQWYPHTLTTEMELTLFSCFPFYLSNSKRGEHFFL